MKYVRTKDTIFESISKAGNIYSVTKAYGEFTIVNRKIVVKEADTIEELCDLYIYVDRFDNSHKLVGENELRMFNEFFGDVGIIYGAIWTDKGLIYVAKMNAKGEMELL